MSLEILSQKIVKTRKEHQCWGCIEKIPVGTECDRTVTVDMGKAFSSYLCQNCMDYCNEHLDMRDYEDGLDMGFVNIERQQYPEREQEVTDEQR